MSVLWQKMLQEAVAAAKPSALAAADANSGDALTALRQENDRLQRRLDDAATRQRSAEDVAVTLRAEVELLRAREATWRQLHPHLTSIAAAAAAVSREGPVGHLKHWGVPPPLGAIAAPQPGGAVTKQYQPSRVGPSPPPTAVDLESLRHALFQHRCVVPIIALGQIERDFSAAAPHSTAGLQRRFVKNVLKAHFSADLWREIALEATTDEEAALRGRCHEVATQCDHRECPDPQCTANRAEVNELRAAATRVEATRAAEQRELQRMRTMLRFSVLKRDSDKLQEVEARADALVVELDRVKKEQVLEQHLVAYPSPARVPAIAPHAQAPPPPQLQATRCGSPARAASQARAAPTTAASRPPPPADRADGEAMVAGGALQHFLSGDLPAPPKARTQATTWGASQDVPGGGGHDNGDGPVDNTSDACDSASTSGGECNEDEASDGSDDAVEEAFFAPGAAAASKAARVAVSRWNNMPPDVPPLRHDIATPCVSAPNGPEPSRGRTQHNLGRPAAKSLGAAAAKAPLDDADALLDQALPSAADILREDELAERSRQERRAALLAKLRGNGTAGTGDVLSPPPTVASHPVARSIVPVTAAPQPATSRSRPEAQQQQSQESGRATRAAIQAYFTSTRLGGGSVDDVDGLLGAMGRSKAAGAAPVQLQRWLSQATAGGNHSGAGGGRAVRPQSAGARMSDRSERPSVLAQPPAAGQPNRPLSAAAARAQQQRRDGASEMWRETYADGPSRHHSSHSGGAQTSRTSTSTVVMQRPPSAGAQRRVSSASAFSLLVQKAAATYRAPTPQRK